MNLEKLFRLCDNLGQGTMIEVRSSGGDFIDYGGYAEMHAKYGVLPIVGFKIDDGLHATIYLGVK